MIDVTGGMIDGATTTIATHTVATVTPTSTAPISLPGSFETVTPPRTLPMDNIDVLRLVVSFVGPQHYRFVAIISKSFKAAYAHEFPNDTDTVHDATTVEHAKICWGEMKYPTPRQQRDLSYSEACFGSLPAMQYLRSVGCQWDEETCVYAAWNGHLSILQYIHENGTKWPFNYIEIRSRKRLSVE